MPVGEIIAIGTELLLGDIVDTNTSYLARTLRELGIDLYRTMIVGDNEKRIVEAIHESMQRAQIIITTGGLGPTIDDPTRQAIAQVFGVDLEFRPELWEQIEERFSRFKRSVSENNRRQAFIPSGAVAIENQVGTAPAFFFDSGEQIIIALPGVPREMEYLTVHQIIPLLKNRFDLRTVIKSSVLHTAGIGESQVDQLIGDFERLTNPTVGLLAYPGQIDIRITAKASSMDEANELIAEITDRIRALVGEDIYGVNDETLESVIQNKLANNLKLGLAEFGLNEAVTHRMNSAGLPFKPLTTLNPSLTWESLRQNSNNFPSGLPLDALLAVKYVPGDSRQGLSLFLKTEQKELELQRSYGGPPELGIPWAVNTTLDFIRRNLR